MGKKISLLLLFLIGISFVSASSYTVNEILKFKIPTNESSCNITIDFPNSTTVIDNQIMDINNGYASYEIGSGILSVVGDYKYYSECGSGEVEITRTGFEKNREEIFVYTIILLALFGLLIACFMYRKSLPEYNYDEEDGYVISVNKLAHLRPVLLGIGWILLLAIMYILSNISIAYISAEFIGNFMFAIWSIMMWSNLVILPIWVIYMINDFIKKSKLREFIERGGVIQNGQI